MHAPSARIDVKIGLACNNRCEFCVQGDKRLHHGARPLAQARADLEDGRRRGATGIVRHEHEPRRGNPTTARGCFLQLDSVRHSMGSPPHRARPLHFARVGGSTMYPYGISVGGIILLIVLVMLLTGRL